MTGTSSTAEYLYDVRGRRVAKVTGGITTTHFIYDTQYRVIEERDEGEALLATYTYGRGMDEPLTMERGGSTYYYHRDALGSITEVTDASGTLVERYEYDVYGAVTIFDGSGVTLTASATGNPYLFTGRRYDPESGNYYYRARTYSPRLGRFLSQDPLGFDAGDYNLYRYAFNNPTNLTDPTGEAVVSVVIAGVLLTLKAVDYGWTAWDTWQSYQVLKDECASDGVKLLAVLNIALAVALESIEPDEWLPANLPVDDVARKALLRGAREALEEGGIEGLERFLRRELGDDLAERVLRQMDLADDLARKGAREAFEGLGDLTLDEARRIQAVVDEAGEPLWVVGSTAEGIRRNVGTDLPIGKGPGTRSDIDYYYPGGWYSGDTSSLPGIDWHGILGKTGGPRLGPGILFRPGELPKYYP